MSTLADLRRIHDAATPGEWLQGDWHGTCHLPEHRNGHPGRPHCRYDYELVTATRSGASVVSLPEENVCLIGWGENGPILSEADAQAIVTYRNTYGLLLDLWEAAEQVIPFSGEERNTKFYAALKALREHSDGEQG